MEEMNKDKQQGFAAVKPEEKSYDKSVVGGIALVIIIILGAVGYWVFGVDKGADGNSSPEDINVFNGEELDLEDSENSETSLTDVASKSGTASVVSGLRNFSSVKVAVLADPEVFDYHNRIVRGCDVVVLTDRKISPTPKILNAALNVLFNEGDNYGFNPGNFIASQKDLKFREAVIEGKTAKIYLTGSVGPIGGVCDTPRIEVQIQETALQFDTVSAVEIYLNNEPLNIK